MIRPMELRDELARARRHTEFIEPALGSSTFERGGGGGEARDC